MVGKMSEELWIRNSASQWTWEDPVVENIFDLGWQLCSWSFRKENQGKRLVIGISAPAREFLAVLIASGWACSQWPTVNGLNVQSRPPQMLEEGEPVWLLKKTQLIQGSFVNSKVRRGQDQVNISGRNYLLDDEDLLLPVPERVLSLSPEMGVVSKVVCLPDVGGLRRWRGTERSPKHGMMIPLQNILLIGIKSALYREASFNLGIRGEVGTSFSDLIQLEDPSRFSWVTRISSTHRAVDEMLSMRDSSRIEARRTLLIMDGNGPASYIHSARARVNVAIFDRSVASENAEEQFHLRSMKNGKGIVTSESLNWSPNDLFEFTGFWETVE